MTDDLPRRLLDLANTTQSLGALAPSTIQLLRDAAAALASHQPSDFTRALGLMSLSLGHQDDLRADNTKGSAQ